MSEYFPPTDVSPQGPFPEHTVFFEDDMGGLYVHLHGLGLYRASTMKLDPVEENLVEGLMHNFSTTGGDISEEAFLRLLSEK